MTRLYPAETPEQKLAVDALWLPLCQRQYAYLPTDWLDRCGRIRAAMLKEDLSVRQFWYRAYFLLSGVGRIGLFHSLRWLVEMRAFRGRENEARLVAWYRQAVNEGTTLDIARSTIASKIAPRLTLMVGKRPESGEDLQELFPDAVFRRRRGDDDRYMVTIEGGFKFVWNKGANDVLVVHIPLNVGKDDYWRAAGDGFFETALASALSTTRGLAPFFYAMYADEEEGERYDRALFAALQLPDKAEKQILYRACPSLAWTEK